MTGLGSFLFAFSVKAIKTSLVTSSHWLNVMKKRPILVEAIYLLCPPISVGRAYVYEAL